MKKVIGLTGGIASGKSTVVDFLVSQGFIVIDADKVVRELQEPGGKLYEAIVTYFGTDFLDREGKIDRGKLGALIFSDAMQREKLSEIQDEIIREELYRKRDDVLASVPNDAIIFMDIPLLIEYRYTGFDEIWLVAVPEAIQLKRLMARNNLTKDEAEHRIASQMKLTDKRLFADRIFDNTGSIKDLQEKIQQALVKIR